MVHISIPNAGAMYETEKLSNKEILEKAIQKAIAGGWDKQLALNWILGFNQVEEQEDFGSHIYGGLIFNHDFAKALWGDTPIHDTEFANTDDVSVAEEGLPLYKFRLKQMVIADDPIQYLGEKL